MWRTAERRFVRHFCLRNLFPPFLLGFPSIHSLPEAGSWERPYAPPVLHCGCIMPIPSLQLKKKAPVSCREAEGLVTDLWGGRFVTMQWLCSQLCYETAAKQCLWKGLLATVGWKWGCQPFSCPCTLCVTHCRKKICSICLFQESMPFVKSKPPLPTRSLRSLRSAVHSTSSALCLHHTHPFVAVTEKDLSHAEKQRVWSRSCGLQDLLQYCDCARATQTP